MLSGANCLILDEPTNHLDLEAIEALDEGLVDFSGVLLFSSHDHEFVTSIANRIIENLPRRASLIAECPSTTTSRTSRSPSCGTGCTMGMSWLRSEPFGLPGTYMLSIVMYAIV